MPIIATPGLRRPGFYRRLRMWWGGRPLLQLAILLLLGSLALFLATNVSETMQRIGISPGFDFLWRSTGFEIGESSIPFSASDPYIRAIAVGLINTLKVALFGCVLATIIGVMVGVAGLSGNLLLAALVRWYVEIIRNTPLLLQLFFWISLAKAFPAPRQATALLGSVYLTNRGVYIPSIIADGLAIGVASTFAILIVGYAGLLFLLLRAGKLNGRNAIIAAIAAVSITAALFRIADVDFTFEIPSLAGFNIRGGYNLTPEFAALLTGLVVKFSAVIAEIVRAGIQSVNRGQWEAARALGLHDGQIMRLIVLPQALRVITPLTTSSYLDLTKDSSLAVAIGYPDLVSIVNTTANTTGQSLEALLILIGTYLAINLAVSALMNEYNRRVALKGTFR